MKHVRFGEVTIVEIENISKYLKWDSSLSESLIRNIRLLSIIKKQYNEKKRLKDLSDIIKMICSHDDIESVDLHLKRGNTDIFFNDLYGIMRIVLDRYSKKYTLNCTGDKTFICFNDDVETHLFGEDMELEIVSMVD